MRVLVTGASGFVGRAVCRSLAGRGLHVIAAVRRAPTRPIEGATTTLTVGNPWEPATWRSLLADGQAETIVHLIGHTHGRARADNSRAAFRRVNVDITHALATAAAETVTRFVYVSSVKAVGERSVPGRPLTDHATPAPEDAYGQTKLEAERVVAQCMNGPGQSYVVLRPPMVYGPGVGGNFRRLARLAALPVPLPLGALQNERSLVAVDNLADAIGAALIGPRVDDAYFVSDGLLLSTVDLVRQLGWAQGNDVRLFAPPAFTWRAIARLPVARGAVTRLTGSLAVDASRFQETFAWHPPRDPAEALREAVR